LCGKLGEKGRDYAMPVLLVGVSEVEIEVCD
jgi:hypothetical protein